MTELSPNNRTATKGVLCTALDSEISQSEECRQSNLSCRLWLDSVLEREKRHCLHTIEEKARFAYDRRHIVDEAHFDVDAKVC